MNNITEKEVVRIVSDYVSNMSHDPKKFAELVAKEHRTLQQSIFQLFLHCCTEWARAEKEDRFDLRNGEIVEELLPHLIKFVKTGEIID